MDMTRTNTTVINLTPGDILAGLKALAPDNIEIQAMRVADCKFNISKVVITVTKEALRHA